MSTTNHLDDLFARYQQLRASGQQPSLGELCRDCAELLPELQSLIAAHEAESLDSPTLDGESPPTRPPSEPPSVPATLAPASAAFVSIPPDARAPHGYELLGVLGRGGMGVVYKARHRALNRIVALKMILSGIHAGSDEMVRFQTEAESIARLQHPAIVAVYEVGQHEGRPFFSLEFCAGRSLEKKLAGTPMLPRQATELVKKLAEGVQAAHEAKVIHRDLKPANVLLASDGSPKITDFGLAKKLDEQGQTHTGTVMGTPSYMAPEQASGARNLGVGVDVYALGAILYECLIGRPPFRAATSYDTLLQVVNEEPVAPRQLNAKTPADLETIVLKCLAKDPARRYASARELADDLGRFLADEPIAARPAGAVERSVKWARRRPTVAALFVGGVLASLLVSVLAVVATYHWREADRQHVKAESALKERDKAEHERLLAQLDALCNAAPSAVPVVLKNLEENRGEIGSELREKIGSELRKRYASEQDSAKKTRLALALLPDEPDTVRAELVEKMLTVDDPAEAVLIRDTLKPHGGEWSEELWKRVDGDERRFRALVALAAFDPKNARWNKEAEALVEELLTTNPLRLGQWVHALSPVRSTLKRPLGKAFRDAREERAGPRLSAAEVLSEHLKANPDFDALYELLLDADWRQHALLRPLLDPYREKALERLPGELLKQPDYWKDTPLDAKWTKLEAAIVGEIEKAGGIVADRWALCQMLPMDRLSAVTESLRAAGYRPLSVRPIAPLSGSARLVSVVWTRDGLDWKLESSLTLDASKQRDSHWQKEGLIVADVAAYSTKDGVRYLGLWRTGEKDEKAVLYAHLTEGQHQLRIERLEKEGHIPERLQALAQGEQTRYSGVWRKDVEAAKGNNPLRPSDDEPLYRGHVADGAQLLLDVHVSAEPPRPWQDAWLADLQEATGETPAAMKQRAVAYYQLGRDREAFAALGALLDKGQRWAYGYRAVLRARTGNDRLARRDLELFTKSSPDRVQFAATKALVEVYLGQASSGLTVIEEAIKSSPQDVELLFQSAGVYARASEVEKVRRLAWSAGLLGSPSLILLAVQPKDDLASKYAERSLDLLRQSIAAGYRDFDSLQSDSNLESIRSSPGYLALLRQHGLNRRYASVWRDDPTKRAESLQGLSPEAHLMKCRELAANGYRPVSLSLALLEGEKVERVASVWHRPIDLSGNETHMRRQAAAAALLLALREPERVWPLFRHSVEPTRRSYLIWRAGVPGNEPKLLIERLKVEKDDSARRALILALGESEGKQLPARDREPLVKTLVEWYRNDPDPGVHAAISWLLRHKSEGSTLRQFDWGQAKALDAIDKELRGAKPRVRPPAVLRLPLAPDAKPQTVKNEDAKPRADSAAGWYINGQGQTMVMIRGPVEFRMGSPLWEVDRVVQNERRHLRLIPRSYAIASMPVTVEQYRRFLKDRPHIPQEHRKNYSPEDSGPIIMVSWHAAAEYCNWLSEQEGIPPEQWCYTEKIGLAIRTVPDYVNRKGYRLPTEAELEYACRSGSEESRYFGESVELIPRYAHFHPNSKDRTWPVGQKRPNDLGLFDTYGNVWNWCHDRALFHPRRRSPKPTSDSVDSSSPAETKVGSLRGGSFNYHSPFARSAKRNLNLPANRYIDFGLRVCRTTQ